MDAIDALANYGALGVVVIGFLAGLLVAKPVHDRVIAERDRAEDQRDQLIEDMLGQFTPVVERATAAIAAREDLENLVIEVLVDVRRLLEGRG